MKNKFEELMKLNQEDYDSIIEFVNDENTTLVSLEDKKNRKLQEIKEIEEELGIDLVILFKALKYGVYYFTNGTQLTKDYVYLMNNYMSVGAYDRLSYSFITAFEKQQLSFNEYGKTWALTKEELEND